MKAECLLDAAGVALPDAHRAAVKTLERMGYTYHGAQLWKPPLGNKPAWLDALDGEDEYLSWMPHGVAAPVRTWQHDETGRITQTPECPGPRWTEVPAGVKGLDE